jgi:stage V sporulation protein SpoVS
MAQDSENSKVFKVASTTSCTVLASGLFKELTKSPPTELRVRAVGASALNQAIKAVANLNSLLASKNKWASVVPYFDQVKFPDSDKLYTVLEMKLILHEVC